MRTLALPPSRLHRFHALQKIPRFARTSVLVLFCLLLSACAGSSVANQAVAPVSQPTGVSTDSEQPVGIEPPLAAQTGHPPVELLHPRGSSVWLGVELKARERGQAGVLIRRVLPGSPAEKAQLLSGDILMTIDARPLSSPSEVSSFVRAQANDSILPVTVERAGKLRLMRVRFELIPEFEDRLRLAFVGKPAPEISGMVTFQGEVASLKELRGQIVVLEFWASFCQVCRIMGPTLDSWHRNYLAQGAQVVGVTVDPPDIGLQAAQRAQMGYSLGSDQDGTITHLYMASQIPTLFIIDREGVVLDAVVGYSQERLAATQQLIEEQLAKRP